MTWLCCLSFIFREANYLFAKFICNFYEHGMKSLGLYLIEVFDTSLDFCLKQAIAHHGFRNMLELYSSSEETYEDLKRSCLDPIEEENMTPT